MKWISRYRSENPWYCAVFSPTETILSKPGLKKARKASQFSKRSSKELLCLQRAPFRGVLFYISILNWCNWHSCCDFSRLQMWLQPDRVSCLKMLINTIISRFQSTQKFTLWVLFLCFLKKLTLFFREIFVNLKSVLSFIEYFI